MGLSHFTSLIQGTGTRPTVQIMVIVGFTAQKHGDFTCIGCYKKLTKDRYLIVDKAGNKKSAFDIVELFFNEKINVTSVKNTFLFRPSLNLMKKWDSYRKKFEHVKSIITDQSIITKTSTSPSTYCSPKRSKTRTSSVLTPAQREEKRHATFSTPTSTTGASSTRSSTTHHFKARLRLDLDTADDGCEPLCTDIDNLVISPKPTVPCSSTPLISPAPPVPCTSTPHQSHTLPRSHDITNITPIAFSEDHFSSVSSKSLSTPSLDTSKTRCQEIHYRSLALKERLEPAIASISNGSIRKGVRLLAAEPDTDDWLNGVTDILEVECRKIEGIPELKDIRPKSLSEFNVDRVISSLENQAPVLLKILTNLCKCQSLGDCQFKVLMCIAIILQERNLQINAFQSVTSLVLHENCLQQDGMKYLHNLGIVVSRETIHNRLHAAESEGQRHVETIKATIEKKIKVC